MDYERISVAIRERSAAEAIDVGFALARRHYPALLLATALTAVPAALASGLLLATATVPLAAIAVFWWLLPLYERLPLLVASRVFFGESPRPLALMAREPAALLRALAGDLTYRRLAPWRSYLAPVRQLEGLAGAALARRLRAVARSGLWAASGLAAAVLLIEVSAWLGALVFVHQFQGNARLTEVLRVVFAQGFRGPAAWVLWAATVVLVTPFSVCAGFALYINHRVGEEGWDIELKFRQLARRLTAPTAGGRRALGTLLALALWTAGERAAAAPLPPTEIEVKAAIGAVLSDPEFGVQKQRVVWRARGSGGSRAPAGRAGSDSLGALATLVADAAPWVLGGGAAVLLAVLLVRSRLWRPRPGAAKREPRPLQAEAPPAPAREALPRDWPRAAALAWEAGDPVRGLSLLYRGALAAVGSSGGIELPASLTESECVALVRGSVPPSAERDLLERVAEAWVRAAYAQSPPERPVFEELRAQAAALVGSER